MTTIAMSSRGTGVLSIVKSNVDKFTKTISFQLEFTSFVLLIDFLCLGILFVACVMAYVKQ